ncbi:MAG: SDR family oxidoreductase [Actinomycetia bacterium]|nr:SDR family oxidoreductase [Actinomycetes bacterium]
MGSNSSSGVAIVTGSAGGIGSAVATALLEENPETHCAAVDLRPGHASVLTQQYGSHRVLEVLCDVSRPQSVRRAMEEIERWNTPVRSLVNCAGIQLAGSSVDFSPEGWQKVIDINLSGTFYWCQAAGKHMSANQGGAIVNLSSVSEFFGWPLRAPYAATKAAVSALTRTLATEWAHLGIRVNAVAPGFIDTPLAREAIESGRLSKPDADALHAQLRFGATSELASAIAFLLSAGASFITGETLKVDGGLSAKKLDWPPPQ